MPDSKERSGEAGPPTEPETDLRSGDGPRANVLRVGDEELVVLSVPLPKLEYPAETTSAEREIIDLIVEGSTVREIAEKRGASLRTVTTQLSAIFRKAGVNSQAELVALMMAEPEDRLGS